MKLHPQASEQAHMTCQTSPRIYESCCCAVITEIWAWAPCSRCCVLSSSTSSGMAIKPLPQQGFLELAPAWKYRYLALAGLLAVPVCLLARVTADYISWQPVQRPWIHHQHRRVVSAESYSPAAWRDEVYQIVCWNPVAVCFIHFR